MNVSQALTWAFTFLVGILLSSVNFDIVSLLGGSNSILRTFLGGTSKKKTPCITIFSPAIQLQNQISCIPGGDFTC